MPRLRSHPFIPTSILVAALVLFSASALLAQPLPDKNAKPPKTVTWVLTQGKVIAPGTFKGNVTTDYVVEAMATGQGQARVRTGKFTIKCTIEDQGAGQYLLRGAWDITREGAARKTHHTPDSIKGVLVAKLDYNPAAVAANPGAGGGAIKGNVVVSPKRRLAGKETKARGTFEGDQNFNGTLTISRR